MRYKVREVLMTLRGLLLSSTTVALLSHSPGYSMTPEGQTALTCQAVTWFLWWIVSSIWISFPWSSIFLSTSPFHYFTSSLLHTQSRPQDPTAHPTPSLPDLPLPTPPHPCQTSSKTAPGALSTPLRLQHFCVCLFKAPTSAGICLCVFQPRLSEDDGSHSGCTIKSTRELLKVKPIIISWKGTHKTPKLPKWFIIHRVENDDC